jgi:hypothetical protein
MAQALDSTEEVPEILRFSMWRVKPNRPFSADVTGLYGETTLVRQADDSTVRVHTRGGKGLEASLSVDDFLTWYEICHKEGDKCKACHPDRC